MHGEPVWSRQEQLLAATLDAVRGLTWVTGGGKGPKPKPTYAPGREKSFGRATEVDQIRDFLVYRNGRAPEVK